MVMSHLSISVPHLNTRVAAASDANGDSTNEPGKYCYNLRLRDHQSQDGIRSRIASCCLMLLKSASHPLFTNKFCRLSNFWNLPLSQSPHLFQSLQDGCVAKETGWSINNYCEHLSTIKIFVAFKTCKKNRLTQTALCWNCCCFHSLQMPQEIWQDWLWPSGGTTSGGKCFDSSPALAYRGHLQNSFLHSQMSANQTSL